MDLVWTGVFTLILTDTEGQLNMQFITKMAKNFSSFLIVSFLNVCVCIRVYACAPHKYRNQRLEIGSLGTGVTEGCGLACKCWELNLGLL